MATERRRPERDAAKRAKPARPEGKGRTGSGSGSGTRGSGSAKAGSGRAGSGAKRSDPRRGDPKRGDSKRAGSPGRSGGSSRREQGPAVGHTEPTGGFGPFASGDEKPRKSRGRPEPEATATDRPKPAGLRVVRGKAAPKRAATKRTGTRRQPPPSLGTPKRRNRRSSGSPDVRAEVLRLGGRKGERLYRQVEEAADAYSHGRERVAVRILEPVRDVLPGSPSVRELLGLSLYRLGRYKAAAKELERYADLTNSVDQHPVLMDCERAQGHHRRVENLWTELAAASPSAELVAEGRIVRAGDLADQGKLHGAIAFLGRRADPVKRPREHHLRVWYALADLEERAGNTPRARELFRRIEQHDRTFSDVAERLASLR